MSTLLPLTLRALVERLHYACRGPQRVVRLDVFFVDMSEWKLAFTDRTPCIWIHTPELLGLPANVLATEIRDAVRQQEWQNDPVLVMVDGDATELQTQLVRPLAQLAGAYTKFVVLGESEQKEIFDAPAPTAVMLDLVVRQMPRAQLAPYQQGRPVTGNRFFGRQYHLNKILQHSKINYLITGDRRIGKSSLLQELNRLMDLQDPPAEGEIRRLYVDCSVIHSEEDFYREIVNRLRKSELKRLLGSQGARFRAGMFQYLANLNGGPITFLLDEMDELLVNLGRNQELFQVLRKVSMEERVARFIVAGYREVQRAMANDSTAFYNLGEPITMEPLQRQEVAYMIETPMDHLRINLPGRNILIQRIFRETGGMPHLIQYYLQTLLEHLDHTTPPGDTISEESLQAVYDNPNLYEAVIGNFIRFTPLTERAVVFAMMQANAENPASSFSLKEIDQQLRKNGFTLAFPDLNDACKNLELASILQRHGKNFAIRLPLFARMLADNYEASEVLETMRAEWVTV